jgi:hypothetical protein
VPATDCWDCQAGDCIEFKRALKRSKSATAYFARMSCDTHGGNGISDEFHVVRHVMNFAAFFGADLALARRTEFSMAQDRALPAFRPWSGVPAVVKAGVLARGSPERIRSGDRIRTG